MGIRADVIHELTALDSSVKALRKFGLSVGGVFALLAVLGGWKHWPQAACLTFAILGGLLIGFGLVAPALLKAVHRAWMTLALVLGWCMSRLILTVLFVLAVIPVALLGRLLKLPFTQIRRAPPRDSYWLDSPPRSVRHHTDMF